MTLLSLFPFISCGNADPDNAETDKQENTENGQVPGDSTDPGKGLIVYYSYSRWINGTNHAKRESLVKEWLEKYKIK